MNLPLLINPVPKAGNGTSLTVLASQVKEKGLLLVSVRSIYKIQHDFFLFFFSFPSFFLNSNCMTPYLAYKLLSPKPLLQK